MGEGEGERMGPEHQSLYVNNEYDVHSVNNDSVAVAAAGTTVAVWEEEEAEVSSTNVCWVFCNEYICSKLMLYV